MSCHVISCHVMSCHVMSSHVLSCHVISCHLTSCHVMSRLVMSCYVMSCHVMSSHVCHVMSSHVFSRVSRHVLSCHVMSRHVMSCHVMSCHVISRLLTCVTSCHVMSCRVMSSCSRILLPNLSCESSKFFYYGGGVAPTRFSKPWPCAGIRLRATLSLWRRAHCERVRGPRALFFLTWASFCVAGCGDRACRGHVAGVLGGVPGGVRGAVPWGLGSGRVFYARGQRAFRVAGCGHRARW